VAAYLLVVIVLCGVVDERGLLALGFSLLLLLLF
jgi:hypothetical protein